MTKFGVKGSKTGVCTGIQYHLWQFCLLVVSLEAYCKLDDLACFIFHYS
jgi:hypothetical protein